MVAHLLVNYVNSATLSPSPTGSSVFERLSSISNPHPRLDTDTTGRVHPSTTSTDNFLCDFPSRPSTASRRHAAPFQAGWITSKTTTILVLIQTTRPVLLTQYSSPRRVDKMLNSRRPFSIQIAILDPPPGPVRIIPTSPSSLPSIPRTHTTQCLHLQIHPPSQHSPTS